MASEFLVLFSINRNLDKNLQICSLCIEVCVCVCVCVNKCEDCILWYAVLSITSLCLISVLFSDCFVFTLIYRFSVSRMLISFISPVQKQITGLFEFLTSITFPALFWETFWNIQVDFYVPGSFISIISVCLTFLCSYAINFTQFHLVICVSVFWWKSLNKMKFMFALL